MTPSTDPILNCDGSTDLARGMLYVAGDLEKTDASPIQQFGIASSVRQPAKVLPQRLGVPGAWG